MSSPNSQSTPTTDDSIQPAHPDGDCCDNCGSLRGLDADSISIYETPPAFTRLCRDCAETLNTHTAAKMTDTDLTAAIMSDSLGYASPRHAANHVTAFRDDSHDDTVHCERARAMFDNSLSALIERARRHWCRLSPSERDVKRQQVAEWQDIAEQDEALSLTVSLMYPTA